MADKQQGASSVLMGEIISLSSKRLDALCEKSRREQVAKLLHRRRRKWRKKHRASSPPRPGVVEHDQLDCLLETSWKLKCELVTRREVGTSDAMKLQNQESLHSLEVFRHRLDNENRAIEPYRSRVPHQEQLERHSSRPGADRIVKDLETTLSQAKAVSEIRKMKHAMTPRIPQLHNRTLSGNIFDQSLGILEDSRVTPEHAHLDIIGKEVSIWQEDSENQQLSGGNGEGERQRHPSTDSGVVSGEARMVDEAAGAVVSPEKFADDPPGIGMEVVCAEDIDLSDSVNTESSVLPIHNGVLNGLKGISMDYALTSLQQEHNETTAEDSDGEVHKEIMKMFQNARYELRYPVQRYSNHASQCTGSKMPPDSSEILEEGATLAPSPPKKRGRPRKSQTPSLKPRKSSRTPSQINSTRNKRGRSRKNSAHAL